MGRFVYGGGMLSDELNEAIAGSRKHTTRDEYELMLGAGRGIWGNEGVVSSLRGYADKAPGKNRMLLLVLARAVEEKDKAGAARTYAKIPKAIREKYVVVAVRDELD